MYSFPYFAQVCGFGSHGHLYGTFVWHVCARLGICRHISRHHFEALYGNKPIDIKIFCILLFVENLCSFSFETWKICVRSKCCYLICLWAFAASRWNVESGVLQDQDAMPWAWLIDMSLESNISTHALFTSGQRYAKKMQLMKCGLDDDFYAYFSTADLDISVRYSWRILRILLMS